MDIDLIAGMKLRPRIEPEHGVHLWPPSATVEETATFRHWIYARIVD